jgi:hypothetical protein
VTHLLEKFEGDGPVSKEYGLLDGWLDRVNLNWPEQFRVMEVTEPPERHRLADPLQ